MNRVVRSLEEWTRRLEREYPGVRFEHSGGNQPGLNAIADGVLVGRYHSERDPAYGVVFSQPRSCGERN